MLGPIYSIYRYFNFYFVYGFTETAFRCCKLDFFIHLNNNKEMYHSGQINYCLPSTKFTIKTLLVIKKFLVNISTFYDFSHFIQN